MTDSKTIRPLNLNTDTVSGSKGSVFAEIQGKRYMLASLSKFKAKFKVNTIKKGVLGLGGKQSKAGGWEGTWEASFYYNQSTLRELAKTYAETGVLPTLNIQVVNEDPTSLASIGRQSVTFIDCIAEDITLAMIDVEAEILEEDVSGTFNDFRYNDKFKDFPTA